MADVDLNDANALTAASAIIPRHHRHTYMPLLSHCPLYIFMRTEPSFDVSNVILCFAATYMQRYLLRMRPDFHDWFSDDGFAATPPTCEEDVQLIVVYLTCISLAYKHFADETQVFSLTEACRIFLLRFFDQHAIFSMELEVMEALDYRLNHQVLCS